MKTIGAGPEDDTIQYFGLEIGLDQGVIPHLDRDPGPFPFQLAFRSIKTVKGPAPHILQVESDVWQIGSLGYLFGEIVEDIKQVLLVESQDLFNVGHRLEPRL